ncbi:hypothetical protein [Vallitalea maricola]|uniref:Uncharacterized protein n=1 Tax=Vallitalea maricola TaxID=3074433 RepID=A0ACB5UMU3_9FIRM|nr:hypothetical protein AN2V17_34090 [Vallitalea sp. AN17-2]
MKKRISKKLRMIINVILDRKAYIKLGKVELLTPDKDRMISYIDTYSIYLHKKDTACYVSGLDADDTKELIDYLTRSIKENTRSIRLHVGIQYIDIPRWAYESLRDEIYRIVGYNSKN